MQRDVLRLGEVDRVTERLREVDAACSLLPAVGDLQRDRLGGIPAPVAKGQPTLTGDVEAVILRLPEAGGEPRGKRGRVEVAEVAHPVGAEAQLLRDERLPQVEAPKVLS